ncbi:MAG: PTS sugar transporter subunit IIA [Planctomycetes bacterium]|nr:PTS sugar transporter subunit IIA [Planctomycetota bacterium]
MNLARHLKEERVDLHLDEAFPEDEPPTLETLAEYVCGLLELSDGIVNPTKLRNDLVNRERRQPTLLGHGVAMPHVRTLQARRLVMAVAVSRNGLPIETPDGVPLRLVIGLVGPTYDDKLYLQVYKRLSEKLADPGFVESIVAAEQEGEVVRALSSG